MACWVVVLRSTSVDGDGFAEEREGGLDSPWLSAHYSVSSLVSTFVP